MSALTEIIFAGAAHYLTSGFGWRSYTNSAGARVTGFHQGADYGTNLKNLPLYALEEGSVYSKGYGSSAGYYIWLHYPRLGVRMCYYHMQTATPLAVGQPVSRGTLCGYTGTTGNSTGIHLHLGVYDISKGDYVDPEIYAAGYAGAVPTGRVGTPVALDTTVAQIEVMSNCLWGRKRPERNENVILGYMTPGVYTVLETRDMTAEASNGYYWYRIGEALWCADGDWLRYHAAQRQEETGENAELAACRAALTAIRDIVQSI